MSTLVCLVSHQSMANVIPVLELNPNKVILLQTKQEKNVTSNIKKLLDLKNVSTEIYPTFIDAYDIQLIKNVTSEIISKNENDISLNITGGTKLMALSAYEVFKSENKGIIYYEPEMHRIISLNEEEPVYKNVKYKINVKDYLLAYGYEIIEDKNSSNRAEFKKKFLEAIKYRLADFIKFMHVIKSDKHQNAPHKSINKYDFTYNKNIDVITFIDNLSKVKIKLNQSNFNFGDWLEDILYLNLKKHDVDDIKYGVKIIKNDIENEIDVMLTKNCKLEIYSCKDKRRTDRDDIYEIELLRNLAGGTFGKANLICTNECTPYMTKLCESLRVNLKIISELL